MIQNIQNYQNGLDEFTQGYNYYGCNFENEHVIFREWLPEAKEVYLVGDFNKWNGKQFKFNKNIYGVYELKISQKNCPLKQNDQYKLFILNHNNKWVYRNQAYTQRVLQDKKTHLFTNILTQQQKNPENLFQPQKIKNLKIYEAHIGMSEENESIASFKDFTNNRLQYIKDLGYNAIQLMAIQEHAYYGSFGYHVTNFFAVSSRYGTIQDFQQLVNKAHQLGLIVLLDVVYSHASSNEEDGIGNMDGSGYQYFHSGSKGNHSQWDSKIFDLTKLEVLRFLLSNVRFWIEKMNLDGFRFDGITSLLYEHHGINYGFTGNYNEYFNDNLIMESLGFLILANFVMRQLKPNSISIAEDVSGLPTLCRPIKSGGLGFDYRLNMFVPDMWIKLLKEIKDENWKIGDIIYNLKNKRQHEKVINYAESHDQALVGDKTISMRLFDEQIYYNMSLLNQETFEIFRGMCLHKIIRFVTFLFGDGYLNFMGNEFGHPEWIDFPRQGNDWSYKHCRRQWSLIENKNLRYYQLFLWEKQMHLLDEKFQLVGQGDQFYIRYHYENQIIVLEKNNVLIIFNFNPQKVFQKVF